jgi:hypothetical protein
MCVGVVGDKNRQAGSQGCRNRAPLFFQCRAARGLAGTRTFFSFPLAVALSAFRYPTLSLCLYHGGYGFGRCVTRSLTRSPFGLGVSFFGEASQWGLLLRCMCGRVDDKRNLRGKQGWLSWLSFTIAYSRTRSMRAEVYEWGANVLWRVSIHHQMERRRDQPVNLYVQV